MKTYDHLIIGAGLTGLSLGKMLEGKSNSVGLLEKSRGVGGRVATRRIDEQGFDHGALFLEEMIPQLQRDLIHSPLGYYREGGMNQLMKDLAHGLEIHKEKKATQLHRGPDAWHVNCECGESFAGKKLILTAPLPQALELLKSNKLVLPEHPLFEIRYTKSLLLLVVVKYLPLGTFSQRWQDHQLTLMDERSLHSHGVILRLSDELSEELFELPDEQIQQKMLSIWNASPMGKLEIEKCEVKKWRYSRPINQHHHYFLELQKNLFLAGDGFDTPLRSAQYLAQVL